LDNIPLTSAQCHDLRAHRSAQWRNASSPVSFTNAPRITRTTIEAAWKRRSNLERLVIRDAECGGLALLVGARSASRLRTWKPRGKNPETGKRWATQRLIIGTPATHGPEAAHTDAGRLKLARQTAATRQRRAKSASPAPPPHGARTARSVLERYAVALPRRPKRRGTARRISPRHAAQEVADVGKALKLISAMDRPRAEIDAQAVARMLADLSAASAEARHA
jgi:hypothetical protein